MKKIVIVYPVHYEQLMGGSELQISYLVKHAKQAGHEVHYIYLDEGVPIVNSDKLILWPIKKNIISTKLSFVHYHSIIKRLQKIMPDLIYTRRSSSWIGIAGEYARKHNIRHIHAISSDKAVELRFSVRSIFKPNSFIEVLYAIRGLKLARDIIVQNQYQKRILEKRFGINGLIINQMTPFVSESSISKKETPIQVLWIANFKDIKQPEIFIELANRLNTICNNINYKMIMAGRIAPNYQKILNNALRLNSQLSYLGELSQENVNKLLQKSHLLVNTSIFEGFSNTFVQAWMRKVPVVSMNSNPNQVLTKLNIGYIAPTLDELTEKVTKLIHNDNLRRDMGERAYIYATENHSLEKNINKILSIIDS